MPNTFSRNYNNFSRIYLIDNCSAYQFRIKHVKLVVFTEDVGWTATQKNKNGKNTSLATNTGKKEETEEKFKIITRMIGILTKIKPIVLFRWSSCGKYPQFWLETNDVMKTFRNCLKNPKNTRGKSRCPFLLWRHKFCFAIGTFVGISAYVSNSSLFTLGGIGFWEVFQKLFQKCSFLIVQLSGLPSS